MFSGTFYGQLFADPLDTAVVNFATPYMVTDPHTGPPNVVGTAFNLTLWHQAHGTPYLPSSALVYQADPAMRIYYLGSYDEQEKTFDPEKKTYKSHPNWLKTSVDNQALIFNQLFEFKTVNMVTPPAFPSVIYTVDDILNPGGADEIASYLDSSVLLGSFFRFYELTPDNGWTFGPGYMLGAFASKIGLVPDPKDPTKMIPGFLSGWDQVELAPTEGDPFPGVYEEFVFLFKASPVPEPSTYLVLGTLLAFVGVVAYRRRQQA